MIQVQIDEGQVKALTLEKIEEHLKNVDTELVYWDTNELKRRTCMSWGSIQSSFFYHPNFPKHKIGQKWYFPAAAAKKFLLDWIEEQGG
ncbi:group-specific protein [Bacillus sp. FJAT-45037]|uniref:group-specific protein n=1 Tax=Bacillus sp. FJAT-45037 TaxID=2011007 RepID=UPI000C24A99C|nr:group-specific protein [Bacillus sp. FJAT-45037]